MTLGARLAAAYAAAIFVTLLLFAAVSVFAIDRTLRSSIDARLRAEANAAAALVDVQHGTVVTDPDGVRQFNTLLSAGEEAAILDASGNVMMSSVASLPAGLLKLSHAREQFYASGGGENEFRALVFPVRRDRVQVGTVLVWRASDWIDETDRGAAVAFGAAAFVIAILAMLAGGAVTRRALDEAFKRQRRFTADASHELRAPLAVIRAEADLALRRERSPAEYQAAFETVASEADHIEMLIGDLLLAARLEDRSFTLAAVDVERTLAAIATRLHSAASAKNATLTVRSAPAISIMAEPRSLERALLAVTHNAIKYSPEGGRVVLEARQNGSNIDVTIRDEGPGFSKSALSHALDRFWREDAARTHDGAGLGLAIARSIVESFGGTLSLENAAPGALVRLRFPEP